MVIDFFIFAIATVELSTFAFVAFIRSTIATVELGVFVFSFFMASFNSDLFTCLAKVTFIEN